MNTSVKNKIEIEKVWFSSDKIYVLLSDNREIGCPLEWFPRLQKATKAQLNNYELICNGTGIHWEELDEDLSAEGFVSYVPFAIET